MIHYSCENCCFRDCEICLRYSKNVTVFIDNKAVTKGTFLKIENDWKCKKFEEAMSDDLVAELNRQLEKND